MASITLPRPSEKGNVANVVKPKPVKVKGVPKKGKMKRKRERSILRPAHGET